jgi:hypothetical protein
MDIQEGLLLINGVDVCAQYGAFLSEDKASDHTNYAALMKPAGMKPYIAVSFREENGERLPDALNAKSEARDVTLQFAIIAEEATSFMQKYSGFIQFLKSGWLNINLPELSKTFRMYFVSCAGYDQITAISNTEVAAKFKVKFREPNPTF